MTKSISVVVPVFNEIESLPELIKQVREVLDKFETWEIIFIDDGSTDGSPEYIAETADRDERLRLIQFFRNYGKAAALDEGFKLAKFDYVVTMDADLQDDPAEIPNLVAKLEEGFDLVSGWKKVRHDPISKRLPSKLFNFVTRILTGVKIHDFNCGLKIYRQAVIKSIDVYGGRHRYIPALAGQKKFKITEIVVNHRPREFGVTKYGGRRLFHGFFDLVTILFLNRYNLQPLHLFGMFGLISFKAGVVVELYVLYLKYGANESFSSHMALLMLGIMLIVIGIQFFSIGLLGEMLAHTSLGNEERVKKIS